MPALNLTGDAASGRKTYLERCVSCHRSSGEGFALGPDFVTVKATGKEKLLTNIIDPNGEIVDRARFFEVMKSGALTHDMMESEDFRVRVYGDSAVVIGVTRTKGKFMGQEFSTQERATDVFVKRDGRWQCVLTHLTRFPNK